MIYQSLSWQEQIAECRLWLKLKQSETVWKRRKLATEVQALLPQLSALRATKSCVKSMTSGVKRRLKRGAAFGGNLPGT